MKLTRTASAADVMLASQPADFRLAAAYVIAHKQAIPMTQRLVLYALYKQAIDGDAPETAERWAQIIELAKHAVWSRYRGMSADEARKKYVDMVHELSHGAWRAGPDSSAVRAGSPASIRTPSRHRTPAPASATAAPAGEAGLRARLTELEAELASLREPEMRGWLYKFSPEAGSWLPTAGISSRWDRRYFVLRQGTLQYYRGEGNLEVPRRAIPLSSVLVYDEGRKETSRHVGVSGVGALFGRKSKPLASFHVFSLYLEGTFGTDRGPGAGALLRLSSSSSAEAHQWIARLEDAGAKRVEGSAVGGRTPTVPAKRRGRFDPFLFPASRPMHTRPQPSLLSHEGQATSDFSGLVNLGLIILFSTHTHLLLDNFLKYGLLLQLPWQSPAQPAAEIGRSRRPPAWLRALGIGRLPPPLPLPPPNSQLILAWLAVAVRQAVFYLGPFALGILAAWLVERAAIKRPDRPYLPDVWANRLHALNVCVALALPCAYVLLGEPPAPAGIVLLVLASTLFMKLVSWAHVHHDLRLANAEAGFEGDAADIDSIAKQISRFATDVKGTEAAAHYPHTVTLPRLLYFILAPTLCYQESFPRSPRVRPLYVVSLLVRGLAMCSLVVFISVQMIQPLLKNSDTAFITRDYPKLLERLIKLSLPVTYVWLAGFYVFFHVWMNLLAELLRFGDRLFYKAWWNAVTFEAYWRLWNLPVHHWISRHVYFPALRKKMSKGLTGLIAFTVSAVFHELVIALPLKSTHMPLAFLAMMAQVPLVAVSTAINSKVAGTPFAQLGNYMFWVAFCFLGQPAAVLLYYMHSTGALYRQDTP